MTSPDIVPTRLTVEQFTNLSSDERALVLDIGLQLTDGAAPDLATCEGRTVPAAWMRKRGLTLPITRPDATFAELIVLDPDRGSVSWELHVVAATPEVVAGLRNVASGLLPADILLMELHATFSATPGQTLPATALPTGVDPGVRPLAQNGTQQTLVFRGARHRSPDGGLGFSLGRNGQDRAAEICGKTTTAPTTPSGRGSTPPSVPTHRTLPTLPSSVRQAVRRTH